MNFPLCHCVNQSQKTLCFIFMLLLLSYYLPLKLRYCNYMYYEDWESGLLFAINENITQLQGTLQIKNNAQ